MVNDSSDPDHDCDDNNVTNKYYQSCSHQLHMNNRSNNPTGDIIILFTSPSPKIDATGINCVKL